MNIATQKGERQVDLSWWLQRHGYSEHDLELRLANGTTALMHAARHGASEICEQLVARGATLDARNADGNNALWLACFAGDLATIDLLCRAGIDIDNQNENGATCLMYAASAGKDQVVARLLAHQANVTLRSLDDFTAIDMASTIQILRLLREYAAKARARETSSADARTQCVQAVEQES
ncbi:MAG TPA: ankyrin repeat domain-containing protein [Polyangiales bacterium]